MWMNKDYKGLTLYRQKRWEDRSEAIRKNVPRLGDCFHNGVVVSGTVKTWHRDICRTLRRSDNITAMVLSLVEEHMLTGEAVRSDAKELCHRWELLSAELAHTQEVVTTLDSMAARISSKQPTTNHCAAPQSEPQNSTRFNTKDADCIPPRTRDFLQRSQENVAVTETVRWHLLSGEETVLTWCRFYAYSKKRSNI